MDEQLDVINQLSEAWQTGHAIVPFLGAGISIGAGVPTISQLKEYFAKFRFYVENGAYGPSDRRFKFRGQAAANPSEYLTDFGWPDPYQLEADLWYWFDESHRSNPDKHLPCGRDQLDKVVQDTILREIRHEEPGLVDAIRRGAHPISVSGNWHALLGQLTGGNLDYVDALFDRLSKGREPGAAHTYLAFLSQLMGWQLFLTINFDSLLEEALRAEGLVPKVFDVFRDASLPHDSLVRGHLAVVKLHGGAYGLRTGERLDYALEPESRDRLLRYIPIDGIVLVLGFGGSERRMTQLMEQLIIRGGSARGPYPSVIWLYAESTPPPALVWLQERASSFGSDRERILRSCRISDAGRFLNELYCRVASTHPAGAQMYPIGSVRPIGVSARVETLAPSDDGKTESESGGEANGDGRLREPAATAKLEPDARPDEGVDDGGQTENETEDWAEFVERPVQIFTSIKSSDEIGTSSELESSVMMTEFVAELGPRYRTIWIDFEQHHTVDGVVTEIVDRLRQYDTALAPFVVPSGDETRENYSSAVRRVRMALRRGRYVLAFDSVAAFARPETVHHGVPECPTDPEKQDDESKRLTRRVGSLNSFLTELCAIGVKDSRVVAAEAIKDSYLCIAVDEPRSRFGKDPNDKHLDIVRSAISKFYKEADRESNKKREQGLAPPHVALRGPLHASAMPSPSPPPNVCSAELIRGYLRRGIVEPSDVGSSLTSTALLILSFFRKPPSVVAVRSLLADACPLENDLAPQQRQVYAKIDKLLEDLQSEGHLARLEGGAYWISRIKRDLVYESWLKLSYPSEVRNLCKQLIPMQQLTVEQDDLVRNTAIELFFVCTQHRRIAKYYYTELFFASKDVGAFFEYLYHRVSSIRYLRLLQLLVVSTNSRNWIRERIRPTTEAPRFSGEDPLEAFGGSFDELLKVNDASVVYSELVASEIRSLRQTLHRERESILASAPADTWIGWIRRIETHDLDDFRFALSPLKSSDGVEIERDDPVTTACLDLRRDLQDLQAKVLREKGDYNKCVDLRSEQIGAVSTHSIAEWIDRANWLRDQGTCLVSQFRYDDARNRFDQAKEALTEAERARREANGASSDADDSYARRIGTARLSLLFRRIVFDLNDINPWELKGRNRFGTSDPITEVHRLCEDARVRCVAGQRDVRRTIYTRAADYADFRCYFLTLEARALYLQDKFARAHERLDRAEAGLSAHDAVQRQGLAVVLLSRAECLLLSADQTVETYANRVVRRRAGQELNYVRSSQLSVFALQNVLESVGIEPRDNDAYHQLTGLAIDAPHDGAALETLKEIAAERPIDRMRLGVEEPGLVQRAQELLEKRKRIQRAMPTDITKLSFCEWRDSLLNDSAGLLDEADHRACIARADRKLWRAETCLDQAERLFTRGRRNVYWWHQLYVLRVQLYIERLLLEMTARTKAFGDTWPEFVVRFQQCVRGALNAIRSARDTLARPRREGGGGRRARRTHLRALWLELMLCSWYLSITIQKSLDDDPKHSHRPWFYIIGSGSHDVLWDRWKWMNESSGNRDWVQGNVDEIVLSLLERSAKDVEWYHGHSIRSRANLLQVVNRAFGADDIKSLMEESQ